ncbi:uncharacterized protein FIBRA_08081 [Fibroporia radiculosa]|uniref:Ketoreductase (KR) domain-containing protein n=1 Tax=Fibroporia radiculosa TaxID=599839 RepID=J4GW61_9APHY|nr:uncharacterized protein FIBRA_08081 [Fibroporia radiculosa]CCM05845.1 predicted protein [Fibroporia radiculosa]
MPSLYAARASNARYSPSRLPVAVFVGGTSGIGQAVAEAFARYTKGNAHIIICGRNKSAADKIIASFPQATAPEAKHEFVECDATLMKNVFLTTSALLARLPKLNYLVLSPGIFTLRGRNETTEGIDRKLALHYYARWKFTNDLIPLLRKTKDAGEDAKVMSVLAPGNGSDIDLDDLGMRKSYTPLSSALVTPTYNDLMFESFAEQQPDLSFIHIHPGVVRTPLLGSLVAFVLYPFMTPASDCAEYMLYGLLDAGPGVHRRDNKGDNMGQKRYYGSDEARRRLWDHTVEEIDQALQSGAISA